MQNKSMKSWGGNGGNQGNAHKVFPAEKYILIDDDATYRAIMLRFAKEKGMMLEVYDSLADLGSIGLLGRYNAAIIDYDLGEVNGVEIAEYLHTLFKDIPMILVSERERFPEQNSWPKCIDGFVRKSKGYDHVLTQARKSVFRSKGLIPEFYME